MAQALTVAQQSQAVAGLLGSLRLEHLQSTVELIETHISFVLVAGDTAYKVKKAVNLGFVDFTTLELRRFYCQEELRLNRRFAPDLYLEVLPVTGSVERPTFGGEGTVIDWAVKMRAFSQDGLWDRLAERDALGPGHVDALAEALCTFHRSAAVAAPDNPFGQPAHVRAPMRDNFLSLDGLCREPDDRARLAALDRWEVPTFDALRGVFDTRLRDGFVRDCHGDLHLGNVTQVDGRTTMFDCLEFSPELRWTDVMSDVGFMAMDLRSHGLARLAHRFVNAYMECTGDHAGLRVLRYYMVHRALVRAKVAALRATQAIAESGRTGAARATHHYLEVALACSRPAAPVLMITHGFSGSGKTTLTQSLLELCGAIRLRADVERKRLFGLPAMARSDTVLKERLYADAATEATQARLREAATVVLEAGYSVVLDATFLAHRHRQQAGLLANRLGVRFVIIDFQASVQTLRERVGLRARRADDPSEADLAVLDAQLSGAQPLQGDEPQWVFPFDADVPLDEARMAERWAPLLQHIATVPAGSPHKRGTGSC